MKIDHGLKPSSIHTKIRKLFDLSGEKIKSIEQSFDPSSGPAVFTIQGTYIARDWTEWTRGFQYGSQVLQFDASGEDEFLEMGRNNIVAFMTLYVSDFGGHDHGFNNVSTFGNLFRLINEGKIPANQWERNFYEFALRISGAVQAKRWTKLNEQEGFIHSFHGPHSLFIDTIRSCRILALSHRLGHHLLDENGLIISLLERMVKHLRATADYCIYYGEGRDKFDVPGRTAHESIFNIRDGTYRCPSTQQGYSPFSTWTRGLAWAMCGFAEQLEFLAALDDQEFDPFEGRSDIETSLLKAAQATCDFYLQHTPTDGVPYWDTAAPNLHELGNYLDRPSDPFNEYEPVDSSAAAIASQALLRLGTYLMSKDRTNEGDRYFKAGLTILDTLFDEPYLSEDPDHQGLILHSTYHRPKGWDHIREGYKIPCGESSMWGDYHAREAALYTLRLIEEEPYLTFFG